MSIKINLGENCKLNHLQHNEVKSSMRMFVEGSRASHFFTEKRFHMLRLHAIKNMEIKLAFLIQDKKKCTKKNGKLGWWC